MNKSESGNNKANMPGRRKALKTALLGGAAAAAMPEKWAKPIVDSVVLPAHASTTDDTGTSPPAFPIGRKYTLTVENDSVIPDPASLAMNDPSLADILMSSAHASPLASTTKYFLEGISLTDFNFTSSRTYTGGNVFWAGGTLQGNSTSNLTVKRFCENTSLLGKRVRVVGADENHAELEITLTLANNDVVNFNRTLNIDAGGQASSCVPET